MFASKTQISFLNKHKIEEKIFKNLKNYVLKDDIFLQTNFLHKTEINLKKTSATIKVSFNSSFYIFYIITGIIVALLPFENALIGSSALALFLIFSAVMYFSLDYKLKTIIDNL